MLQKLQKIIYITFFELQLVFSEIGSIKLLVKFINVRLFENSQVLQFFTRHFLYLFLYILGYLKLWIKIDERLFCILFTKNILWSLYFVWFSLKELKAFFIISLKLEIFLLNSYLNIKLFSKSISCFFGLYSNKESLFMFATIVKFFQIRYL